MIFSFFFFNSWVLTNRTGRHSGPSITPYRYHQYRKGRMEISTDNQVKCVSELIDVSVESDKWQQIDGTQTLPLLIHSFLFLFFFFLFHKFMLQRIAIRIELYNNNLKAVTRTRSKMKIKPKNMIQNYNLVKFIPKENGGESSNGN